MTATAHTPAGVWTRAHRAALVILGLRLAAGGPSFRVVGTGSTAALESVDDGCMLARPGQGC